MKITHHLSRFSTFFKESSLVIQLVIVASAIGIIAGTATVAVMVATPNKNETSTHSTTSESGNVAGDTDSKPFTSSDSEQIDTTPAEQTANEPVATNPIKKATQNTETTTTQPTQSTSQTPTATTTNPTQTATNTAPQQTATSPTPATPTCNQSMKSSYTSLYNSQVNAENASWNNQINAWRGEATGRGGAFSGWVQEQINQNKPAHDARLAQLQTQYHQNLASINCNP